MCLAWPANCSGSKCCGSLKISQGTHSFLRNWELSSRRSVGEPRAMQDHENIKEHGQGGGAELLWGKGQICWKLIQESRQLFTSTLFAWTTCCVWCICHLLLSSACSIMQTYIATFWKESQLSSVLSVLFFVLKFGLIMERIEKNTAEAPIHTAFFQWTIKMWQAFWFLSSHKCAFHLSGGKKATPQRFFFLLYRGSW